MANGGGIESWLTESVTAEEAEGTFTPTPDPLTAYPRMPNKPFGFDSPKWEALKSHMIDSDELWYFCSPQESWQHLAGRAGIALVRGGKVVDTIVLRMN